MCEMFIKVVCIKVGIFEYEVIQDVNRGNLEEAMLFIQENMINDIGVKWELYLMHGTHAIIV